MITGLLIFFAITIVLTILMRLFAASLISASLALWNSLMQSLVVPLLQTNFWSMTSVIPAAKVICDAIVPIGIALCCCLAYIEICKSMTSLLDTRRIETVFKAFLRIAVVGGLISFSYEALHIIGQNIFQPLFIGAESELGGLTGSCGVGELPADLISCFEPSWLNVDTSGSILDSASSMATTVTAGGSLSGFAEELLNMLTGICGCSILDVLVLLVACIIIITKTVSTLIEVCIAVVTRWIRLALHVCIAPVAIATFTSRETSFIGKRYVLSFISVCTENFFCLIILILFPQVVQILINLTSTCADSLSVSLAVTTFQGTSIIFGLIVFSLCCGFLQTLMKSLDHITGQMLSLGGA